MLRNATGVHRIALYRQLWDGRTVCRGLLGFGQVSRELWCQTLASNGACIDWLAIVTKVCDENLDRMINELSFARCSSLHSLLTHFVFQTCCASFVVFALLINGPGVRCSFNMFNMQFKRFARHMNLIIIKKNK